MGFEINEEAKMNFSDLSSMKYFKKSLNYEKFHKIGNPEKTQSTWRLQVMK